VSGIKKLGYLTCVFRKYKITIKLKEGASNYNDELLKILGCSISEPSNWVTYASTKERGLTFLDENGKELDSIVFEHQPLFNSVDDKNLSEKNEIKELICQALFKNYHISPEGVIINVTDATKF
jgi:hypothetical protein